MRGIWKPTADEARDDRGRLWDGDVVTEPHGDTTQIVRAGNRRKVAVRTTRPDR